MVSQTKKQKARQALMVDAKTKKLYGETQYGWLNDNEVQNFAKKFDLEDVLEHIATFAWTFERR